jgi:hypothetical protein
VAAGPQSSTGGCWQLRHTTRLMAGNSKPTEVAVMDPNYREIRGESGNRGLESPVNEVHASAAPGSVSRPNLCASARRLTDDGAQVGIDHAVACPARGMLKSESDLATRRRALLHGGAGSAVFIALAARGRRAFAADTMIAIDNFTFSPTPLTVARVRR